MQKDQKEVMKASEVRNHWSKIINDVFTHNKLIELKKSGLTVAGLISPDDLELLLQYKAKLSKRKKLLEAMWRKFENEPEEILEQEIEKARLEVWEERNKSNSHL